MKEIGNKICTTLKCHTKNQSIQNVDCYSKTLETRSIFPALSPVTTILLHVDEKSLFWLNNFHDMFKTICISCHQSEANYDNDGGYYYN